MSDRSTKVVLSVLGALCALSLSIPVLIVLVKGLSTNSNVAVPGLWQAVETSLEAATVATLFIALFGVPLAWVLARSSRRALATGAAVAVQLPLALPPLVAGIAILFAIGPNGVFGSITGSRFVDTFGGLVAAQIFVAAPFAIIVARSAFLAVDPGLLGVASTLGVRGFKRFFLVEIPAAGAGIAAGLLLAFLRAFGEYGATSLVAYYPTSLPIYTRTLVDVDLNGALRPAAIAILIAAVIIVLFAFPKPHRTLHLTSPTPLVPRGSDKVELHVSTRARVGAADLDLDATSLTGTLAILGPSGSGKTASLFALCGLGRGTSKSSIGGRAIDESCAIGYVPQGGGIDRRMRVSTQIRLAQRVSDSELSWLCEHFAIASLLDQRGASLSGGERQRVAIVRALASAPSLLVFDEPFSALDTTKRREMREQVLLLRLTLGAALILVTHDPDEAVAMCDDLVLIDDGAVVATGVARALCEHPPSLAAAKALGHRNLVELVIDVDGCARLGGTVIASGLIPGSPVCFVIDPRALTFVVSGDADREDLAHVVRSTRTVRGREVVVRVGSVELVVEVSSVGLIEDGAVGELSVLEGSPVVIASK